MRHASSNPAHAKGGERLKPSGIVFTALVSAVVALYAELFREAVNSFRDGDAMGLLSMSVTPAACVVIAGVFAVAFALLLLLQAQRRILGLAFKWRYPIALVVFVILVVAQVSGSSLGLWDAMLNGADNSDLRGVLFGMPRAIRTDEYVVFTPLAFSQEFSGYAACSDIPRAVATNLTIVYAQPAWALATLFRPFLWGYLALGSAGGLAFFWNGRLIALFLVSFEFGRFITHDNRMASLAYALLIAFAPIVQWWFSINGMAELLIFSQGGILAFASFLRAGTRLRRMVMAALASYAAGCFVMVIYPAWQVCVAYFIVAFCIADAVHCRTHGLGALARGIGVRKAFVSWWLVLLCALAVVAGLIAAALLSAMDVVQALGNTAYPGKRVETGGGFAPLLFDWAASWLYPLASDAVAPNACERADMFTLSPLGILLSVAVLFKQRDPYLIALMAVEAVLLAFGIVGFPEPLARLTLLSHVTMQRLALVFGLIDTTLLFRSAALLRERSGEAGELDRTSGKHAGGAGKRRRAARVAMPAIAACSLALGVLGAYMTWRFDPPFAYKLFLALIVAFVALAAFAVLTFAFGRAPAGSLLCVAAVIALAGLCVNPLQQGIAPLGENELLDEARAIARNDPDATWAGDNSVASQALVASGLRTATSVATYPDLDTWRKIDPAGAYEDAYNRYAHISLVPTIGDTSFEAGPDSFEATVNGNDVAALGIDYWLSQQELEVYSTKDVVFTPVTSNGIWTIYRVSAQ